MAVSQTLQKYSHHLGAEVKYDLPKSLLLIVIFSTGHESLIATSIAVIFTKLNYAQLKTSIRIKH